MSKGRPKTIKEPYSYYKIDPEHQDYKGVRFFRVDNKTEMVTQVCTQTTKGRQGKNATMGITVLQPVSFLCNYKQFFTCISTEEEFTAAFNEVVEKLR